MIGMLVGWGLSEKVAKLVTWFVGIGLVVLAFVLALNAYGDARYDAGVSETDAKWEEAGRRLEKQATVSAGKADAASVVRVEEFNDRVAAEKDRLDEAEREGSSPLDVLFGGNSVR